MAITKSISKVAIVDTTGNLSLPRLSEIAVAIQRQMNEHVKPVWGVGVEIIKGFEKLTDVPSDFWIASIVNEIPEGANLNGIHWYSGEGDERKPFAKIRYTDYTSLDFFENRLTKVISEEIVETLIDPFGENKRVGKDPENESAQEVNFLVEIGDPTQAFDIGYYIGDVFVTNFIYPSYFNATHVKGTQYDYLGQISLPLSLAEGGYQIFERAGQWYQAWKIRGKMYFIKQGDSLPDSATNNTLIYVILGVLYSLLILGFYFLNKRKKQDGSIN